jgi:hypothetical protein
LKNDQEKVEDAEDDGDNYDSPDRYFLASIHANSHQEDGNAAFQNCGG